MTLTRHQWHALRMARAYSLIVCPNDDKRFATPKVRPYDHTAPTTALQGMRAVNRESVERLLQEGLLSGEIIEGTRIYITWKGLNLI